MARPHILRLEPFDPPEDPDAAPGAFKGGDAAPPWTLRRAAQNMVWIYLLGLVFLVFAVAAVTDGAPSALELVGRVVAVLGIAVAYVLAAWVCDTPLWARWTYIAGFVGLMAATAPFLGWGFLNYGIYVSILLATLVPWRQSRLAILVWGLGVIAVGPVTGEWMTLSIGLIGLVVGWATAGGLEAGRVAGKLNRAEQRVSVLAVAAERERIGRDLHDILGHSLTAISIKSGLAAKLINRDPAAAQAEIEDIEVIARQALGDVRATASGYRDIRLGTEVASARSILLAVGIAAYVPSAIEPMSDEVGELYGYVVREAVTNVVRHSEATSCTIAVTPDELSVSDDGKGSIALGRTGGSGLQGLVSRMEAAGGVLIVESEPGHGTVVRARRNAGTGTAAAEPKPVRRMAAWP